MGSRAEPTEAEDDAWAQCDACQKWRLLPKDHVVDEGKQWTCALVGRSCDECADDAIEEPPKLDQFARKRFDKDDKKHTAVVDAAIAAARKAGHRKSKDLFPYVWNATRFARKDWKGRDIHLHLSAYISSQCAEEDRSKKTPWWYGVTDIVKAKDEDLLKTAREKAAAESGTEPGSASSVKYAVRLQRRSAAGFPKDAAVRALAALVPPQHTVSLGAPDVTILVEVFKSLCGVAVVPGYHAMHDFNLHAAAGKQVVPPPPKSKKK